MLLTELLESKPEVHPTHHSQNTRNKQQKVCHYCQGTKESPNGELIAVKCAAEHKARNGEHGEAKKGKEQEQCSVFKTNTVYALKQYKSANEEG